MDVIEKDKSEFGYEFGQWTIARLATYMKEQTGIELSGEQIRRILKQKKFAYLWGAGSLDRVLCPSNPLQNTV
jgi:transposase